MVKSSVINLAGLALIALSAVAPAAQASTLPRVDFAPGKWDLALGSAGVAVDTSLDLAVSESLSLGVTLLQPLAPTGFWPHFAVRATVRTGGDPDENSSGFTFAGGVSGLIYYPSGYGRPYNTAWFQPAWVWSWHVWGPIRLRTTLGPVLATGYYNDEKGPRLDNMIVPLWPNVELSFRLIPNLELDFGGNSLVGMRGIW